MKAIFLDCDGVLNNRASLTAAMDRAREYPPAADDWRHVFVLDPACVQRLHRLIQLTGARLVLSSVWRRDTEAVKILRESGVLTAKNTHSVWSTPSLGQLRGHDVERWLQLNPVDQFVVLDDDSDFLDWQRPYLVRTTNTIGLQDEHVTRAVRLLNH